MKSAIDEDILRKLSSLGSEALWKALVYAEMGEGAPQKDRLWAALNFLQKERERTSGPVPPETAFTDVIKRIMIFQLIAADLFDDIDDRLGGLYPSSTQVRSEKGRTFLNLLITANKLTAEVAFRDEKDARVLVLPGWLYRDLSEALLSLDEGEVRAIVQPRTTGRQGQAWSQDQVRLRACEHVYYLVGYGFKKITAQTKVAEALSLDIETLRTWEADIKRSKNIDTFYMVIAKEGGKLGGILESATPNESEINPFAANIWRVIQLEPLEVFGKRYEKVFGKAKKRVD